MHKIVELAFGNRISRAPIKNPKRVLDLGTGTGIWAIEMGDRYPNAESIIGNDLSPIQPRWVPPNVSFEVDDVEADWTYSRKFDLIHSRFFYASIKNWPRLMQQAYDHLEPGGYAEFTDADITWTSPDGSHKGTMTETVQQKFFEAMDAVGIVYSPGPRLEEWMKAQGFEDVTVQRYPLPVGSWPADKKLVSTYSVTSLSETNPFCITPPIRLYV